MSCHWHSFLNAMAVGEALLYHEDCKGLGSFAAKIFVSPTFNSCFLDVGSKHSAWVKCDELHDTPIAQSAHEFGVGLSRWKMSERNGLKDSSDSPANWQLRYVHCPKCLDGRRAWAGKQIHCFTRLLLYFLAFLNVILPFLYLRINMCI